MTPVNSSNSSDPTLRITASGLRQLLTAASDAGLAELLSSASVRNDGEHLTITFTSREVRALTNWLTTVADLHRDAPITATAIPVASALSAPMNPSWMAEVSDVARETPIGYNRASIPTTNSTAQDPQ